MSERPKLTDPKEFDIIRDLYFKDKRCIDDIDPIEKLDRMESKQRNKEKSSR